LRRELLEGRTSRISALQYAEPGTMLKSIMKKSRTMRNIKRKQKKDLMPGEQHTKTDLTI
jgi:hypothetical protein